MSLSEDFTFSQSSLQSYQNCQYQFYLKYMRNLDWPSALLNPLDPSEIERQSGIRFHQLVHDFFLGVPEALLKKFAQEDANPKISHWFANFLKFDFLAEADSYYPELTVHARFGKFNFSAKFDLFVLGRSKIDIFDWKTSRNPPKAEWLRKRIQSQLYPLVANAARQKQFPEEKNKSICFTYWEASFPEKPIQFTFDESDLRYAEHLICDLASEIISKPTEEFHKTSRIERCNYCLYRTFCQRLSSNTENGVMEFEVPFTGQEQTDTSEEK